MPATASPIEAQSMFPTAAGLSNPAGLDEPDNAKTYSLPDVEQVQAGIIKENFGELTLPPVDRSSSDPDSSTGTEPANSDKAKSLKTLAGQALGKIRNLTFELANRLEVTYNNLLQAGKQTIDSSVPAVSEAVTGLLLPGHISHLINSTVKLGTRAATTIGTIIGKTL